MTPRIVLTTIGSLGDLHPLIGLGLALQARGADVLIACAAEYQSKVTRAGLGFRAVRPSFEDLQRAHGKSRAQLTQAMLTRKEFLFREVIVPSIRVAYADMMEILAGADLALIGSLGLGARLAAQQRGVPWIAVVLQPLMFVSAFDPPVIPELEWLSRLLKRLGPRVTRGVLRLLVRGLAPTLAPLQQLRAELGLPPDPDPVFAGQFSTAGAIGLYSPLLGGVQPDYPPRAFITGFALFDSDDGGAAVLDAALLQFLATGPPPLVFTLGSLIVNSPGTFYCESCTAARRLGMRAVLLVGEGAARADLELGGADIFVGAYAPHSQLFPRAAAVIHQGGIGTLAQALLAGRPQLIVPFFGDQADNAARAVNLGVARSLTPKRYDARAAVRELRALMGCAAYEAAAATVQTRLGRENGAAAGAQFVWDRLESRPQLDVPHENAAPIRR